MIFDFDEAVNREGSRSVKYDFRQEFFGNPDLFPMWVADMDLTVPPGVSKAIQERAAHPVYGYSVASEAYHSTMIHWQNEHHGWNIEKDWILFSPTVVTAINVIVQTYTEPGDAIIVQPPVYFPFFWMVERNGRKLMHNQLIPRDGKYHIDFEDLEEKMEAGAKMIILCSPHNPVGRVWTKDELQRLADLCLQYNVIMVSDEIHGDLVFSPNKHTPLASLSEEVAAQTITCIAPSKTFNLAGLTSSSVVISNEELRNKFKKAEQKLYLSHNLFGLVASEAAYSTGGEWLQALLKYLQGNIALVNDFFSSELPEVQFFLPEATYLLWLDFNGLNLPEDDIKERLIHKAGVGLNDGRMFGPGGKGFQRMNIACARSLIEPALINIKKAFV